MCSWIEEQYLQCKHTNKELEYIAWWVEEEDRILTKFGIMFYAEYPEPPPCEETIKQ